MDHRWCIPIIIVTLMVGLLLGHHLQKKEFQYWARINAGKTVIYVTPELGEDGLQYSVDMAAKNERYGGYVIMFSGTFTLHKPLILKGQNQTFEGLRLESDGVIETLTAKPPGP